VVYIQKNVKAQLPVESYSRKYNKPDRRGNILKFSQKRFGGQGTLIKLYKIGEYVTDLQLRSSQFLQKKRIFKKTTHHGCKPTGERVKANF